MTSTWLSPCMTSCKSVLLASQVKSPRLNVWPYLLTAGPFSFQRCQPSQRTHTRIIKNCQLFGLKKSKSFFMAHVHVRMHKPTQLGQVFMLYKALLLFVCRLEMSSHDKKICSKVSHTNKFMPRQSHCTQLGIYEMLFFGFLLSQIPCHIARIFLTIKLHNLINF